MSGLTRQQQEAVQGQALTWIGGFGAAMLAGRVVAGKQQFPTVLRRSATAVGTGSTVGFLFMSICDLLEPYESRPDDTTGGAILGGLYLGVPTYVANLAWALFKR